MMYLSCGCAWNGMAPPPQCPTHGNGASSALPDSELTLPYGIKLAKGRLAGQRPIEIIDNRSLVSMVGEILELLGAEQSKALDAKDDVLYDAWHEAQLAMQQTMHAIRRAKKAGA